ncbi:DUF3558 domain-containing protein [Saccharomonospora xinjiangensis]|uniref:DUF3558 domain-containing protein n=1 Tax=Saccharomonospora xinjiangensis TaxID=75294 RepID=UPI00350F8DB1
MRRSMVKWILVPLVVGVAGCSAAEDGTATGGVATLPAVASSDVVTVPENLDLGQYLEEPCSALNPEVLKSHGYSAEGLDVADTGKTGQGIAELSGPSCGWSPSDELDTRLLTITLTALSSAQEDILKGPKKYHSQGLIELWEETTVSGYPGGYWGIRDKRSRGDCSIVVAVSNDSMFTVNANSYWEQPDRACSDVKDFAVDLIENLKEGA